MKNILCVDMDNTIIYSYKHDIGEKKLNVELYNGREISFISERTYSLLKEVNDKMLIVPTSTRTEEQYRRINSAYRSYTVCTCLQWRCITCEWRTGQRMVLRILEDDRGKQTAAG